MNNIVHDHVTYLLRKLLNTTNKKERHDIMTTLNDYSKGNEDVRAILLSSPTYGGLV